MILLLSVAATAAHVATEGLRGAAPTLGLAILASVVAVAAYWHPHVTVDGATVIVANVLSTTYVPLSRIAHVDTRWALELQLDNGKQVRAFAAPAPGTSAARHFRAEDVRGLPADTYATGTVRVGDKPGTPSGDAAIVVRTALAQWRDSGEEDDNPATRRLNVAAIVATLVGFGAAVSGFFV